MPGVEAFESGCSSSSNTPAPDSESIETASRLDIPIKALGDGFTWLSKDMDRMETLAAEQWKHCKDAILKGEEDVIVLDEFTYAMHYGRVSVADVVAALNRRPDGLHVIITGRYAPQELIDCADLVTEMKMIKHPYEEQGIKAPTRNRVLEMTLNDVVARIRPADAQAKRAAELRQQQLTKPPGSLGRLEELSIQVAGILGTERPTPTWQDARCGRGRSRRGRPGRYRLSPGGHGPDGAELPGGWCGD